MLQIKRNPSFLIQNKAKYSTCAYSKCGKYIAAGCENGEITIWDINANTIVRENRSGDVEAQTITSIDWNPSNNGEIAYTDNSGQFGLVENIFENDDNFLDDEAEAPVNDDVDFGDSKLIIFYLYLIRVIIYNFAILIDS